jgi:hypothetical protein
MNYKLFLAAGLTTALFFASAFAQPQAAQAQTDADNQSPTTEPSTSPVAFVYISNGASDSIYGGPLQTWGFAAAANGELTKIPGSPFKSADVAYMGVNGKYLFGIMAGDGGSTDGIETFSIATNGALKPVQTFKYKETTSSNAFPWSLGLDHSGQVLYVDLALLYPDTEVFQALGIDQSTGKLQSLGQTPIDIEPTAWLSFLADNKFAYSADTSLTACLDYRSLSAFERASNGALTALDIANPLPPTPENGHLYCVQSVATDPSNHIAAVLYDEDASGKQYGNPVMATFTADSTGELTTTSTSANMAQLAIDVDNQLPTVTWMRMAPSGKFLAVASYSGIEVFHFNGASPMTKLKILEYPGPGPLNTMQMYWDNADHLYAYNGNGALSVYTVTSNSVTEAPGSPYSVPYDTYQDAVSGGLIVLPK